MLTGVYGPTSSCVSAFGFTTHSRIPGERGDDIARGELRHVFSRLGGGAADVGADSQLDGPATRPTGAIPNIGALPRRESRPLENGSINRQNRARRRYVG